MDVEQYLIKQGWKKGEGLKPGGIKNALLVKHRKDNKGLGFNPQASEGWWERIFDGHLKSLDVSGGDSVQFAFDEEKRRRETSPLYASFLSGGILQGSIPQDGLSSSNKKRKKHKESSQIQKDENSKKRKKEKSKKGSKSSKS